MNSGEIQKAIVEVLYKAYLNPKGKYRNVTFQVLQKDVKGIVTCEREDVLRELRYLCDKKTVKEKKERYSASKIGNTKIPGGYTTFYYLSSSTIDSLQAPTEYSKIGFMITRHIVKILKLSNNFSSATEFKGDFQSKACFLPINSNVEAGDKIQLVMNGTVQDEKTVGKVEKVFGPPISYIRAEWVDQSRPNPIPTTQVTISGSTFNAPFAAGSHNVVISYNVDSDIDQVLQLIKDRSGLDVSKKEELSQLVQSELPTLLNNPDITNSKTFKDKIKSLGQTWLVPIITQVIATYFQKQLGIN